MIYELPHISTIIHLFKVMSACTFFIRPSDTPPNLEEVKNRIATGSPEEKTQAMKDLIKCIVSDETYPTIIMHVITNIIPTQHKSQELRKVMLLYWEIIEKTKSPTDKSLKEEIFLACNSLRTDLLGFNEYLRGRTLRLISRIMHRGVVEPLASAISSNLKHKSSYVRRNAVICLFNINNAFGSDIIGQIDDQIEDLLKKETDLSTKRNAFLLLNKSNPKLAMEYIQTQIKNQSVEEIGDILQLAILKTLKIKCKEDPSKKPHLLKIVNDFLQKATESVRLQCAITSTAISNSALTIKNSMVSYVNILAKTHEINVKKIILDKLDTICKNSNYLEEDLIDDLIKSLDTPSLQIKVKIIEIIMTGITAKSSEQIMKYIEKEPTSVEGDVEYVAKIMSLFQLVVFKFPGTMKDVIGFLTTKFFNLNQFTPQSIHSLKNILRLILKSQDQQFVTEVSKKLIASLMQIQSIELLKVILNILGNTLKDSQLILAAIDQLKFAIGELPLCASTKSKNQKSQEAPGQEEQKKVFKTVILEDGSYSSELVTVKKQAKSQEDIVEENKEHFRNFLITDSVFGGVFSRNIAKLLYKIRKSKHFNRYACSILMIFCSLLRHYQQNISYVDQAIIDQLSLLIRKIVKPQQFIAENDRLLETNDLLPINFTFNDLKKIEMIEKNPQDVIHFRLLKKQEDSVDFEFDDEQVNDIMETVTEKIDYISKLKSIVQLTGSFDPLYAEAFIRVNKYDLFFEILLINNTKNNLSNVQIEFSSDVETLVLEKAQSVNLRPFESSFLRTQLRFSNSEFGIVYGYINYDNHAGLEQPYLITEQINIDYMQFVEPASISLSNFKTMWSRAEHQTVKESSISGKRVLSSIVKELERVLHARTVEEGKLPDNDYFLNCHLFGKSKLGQNFYINAALFSGQPISLTTTIRSKDKAVRDIISGQLAKHKFRQTEQEDEDEQKQ